MLPPFSSPGQRMSFPLCFVCDEDATEKCKCGHASCCKCYLPCTSCDAHICMECSELCTLCDVPLCDTCTYTIDVCKCCKQRLPVEEQGNLCDTCVMTDWFSPSSSKGHRCTACETHCRDDKCLVRTVASGQNDCPICLDPLDHKTAVVQLCQLHRVCKACEYDTLLGCPICRVGK